MEPEMAGAGTGGSGWRLSLEALAACLRRAARQRERLLFPPLNAFLIAALPFLVSPLFIMLHKAGNQHAHVQLLHSMAMDQFFP